jgi:electron transfer flavoprotein alpha/beta subunit
MGERAQVIVISVGGEARNESCEMASRTDRVRRVVHLRDQALDETDFLSMGRVLAEAARHLEARVILLGEHSDDEGEGLVPAALAHHWHAPLLACVREVRAPSGDEAPWEVTVRTNGSLCKVKSTSPLVLAVPASFAGATAQATGGKQSMCEVETLSLAQLEIDASDLVPRPDLLGAFVALKGERVENKSFDEDAQLILRR